MKTLLTKVTEVEKAAQEDISAAEAEAQQMVQAVLQSEKEVLVTVQREAELKAQAISREEIQKVKHEINLLHQEQETSVARIHEVAAEHTTAALARAKELFWALHTG